MPGPQGLGTRVWGLGDKAGAMTLQKAIEGAQSRFTQNGRFSLLANESIKAEVSRERVRESAGLPFPNP